MTNITNNSIIESGKYDIHDRIFYFVVRVITMVNLLPKNEANSIIIPQILRSVTSIGANDQEADGTLTKKDFIHCCTVVRKETKETLFWLKLIAETNPNIKKKMILLIQENHELASIISSIINKTRS